MASVNPFARAAASGFGWAPSIAKGLGAANPFQAAAKDSLSGASSIPLPRKTDGGARWARIVNAVARKSGAARGEDEIDWAVAADPAAAGDEDDPLADEIEALCLDEEQPRRPQWGSANKKNNKEKPRDKHSYEYLHRHLKDLPQSSRLSEEDRARLDAALRPAFPEKRPLEWPACAPEVLNAQNDCLEIYVLYPDYEIERRPAKGEPGGPVVRIVGKTLQGRTVMLRAHSKLPYWYFRPRGRLLEALQRDEPRTLAWIRERLNQIARDKRTSEREARGQAQGEGRKGSDPDAVVAVTLENDRRSTYGYEHETSAFVRVTMREPGLVPCVRDAVATKRFAWHDELPEALPYERFEADIPYVLRFMIDGGVTGCGWVRVPRAALSQPKERKSRCELELLVDAAQVKGAPDIKATPPLRFLSYDIVSRFFIPLHLTSARNAPGARAASRRPIRTRSSASRPRCTTWAARRPCARSASGWARWIPSAGRRARSAPRTRARASGARRTSPGRRRPSSRSAATPGAAGDPSASFPSTTGPTSSTRTPRRA
jgi:hypothetical protein